MARLSIGVAVSGKKELDDLGKAIGNVTAKTEAFYRAQGMSSSTQTKTISALGTAYKELGVQVEATTNHMRKLVNSPGFDKKITQTQALMVVQEKLISSADGYGAALGRLRAQEDKDIQTLLKKTAAIDAQTAALAKLQSMGVDVIPTRKGKSPTYVDQLAAYEKSLATAGAGVAEFERKATSGVRATSNLSSEFQNLTRRGSTLHDTFRGMSGAAGALWLTYGQMAPMMAGFATIGSTLKTISEGTEFDYTTRAIQKLSGEAYAGSENLQILKKEILAISDVPMSANDLAKGLLEFARAGIEAGVAIKDLGEVARFAYIGEMELGKAVELVVGQMSAFKGLQAGDAVNIMAVIADKTSVSLQQMAEAFKNTTSLGTVMGLAFSDIAVALGIMGQAGVRGATAGAALNTMMYKLIDPTKKAQKMMQDLNVQFSAFDSTTGKVKPLIQTMRELEAATKSLNASDKSSLFENLVGLRGVKALGSLVEMIEKAPEKVRELEKSLESLNNYQGSDKTYLKGFADILSESGKYQLDKLKASFDNLFTANYDNSSVVTAMKNLRETVNSKEVADNLAFITSEILKFINLLTGTLNTFPGAGTMGFVGLLLFGPTGLTAGVALGGVLDSAKSFAAGMTNLLASAGDGARKTASDFDSMFNPFKAYGELVDSLIVLFGGLDSKAQGAAKSLADLGAKFGTLNLKSLDEGQKKVLGELSAGIERIKAQTAEMGKTKLQLIEDGRAEELAKYTAQMGELRAGFGDTAEGAAAFNAELEDVKRTINDFYDGKLADALKAEISSMTASWAAFAQTVIAMNNSIVESARTATVSTLRYSVANAREFAAQAQQAAREAAGAAMSGAQGQGAGFFSQLLSGVSAGAEAYGKQVVSSITKGMEYQSPEARRFAAEQGALYAKGYVESLGKVASVEYKKLGANMARTFEFAQSDAGLKKLLMTAKQQAAALQGASAAESDMYKQSAFSQTAYNAASAETKKRIDDLITATRQGTDAGYAHELQVAKDAEAQEKLTSANKAGAAATKAERESLNKLVADLKIYEAALGRSMAAHDKWMDGAKDSLRDIDKLAEDYAKLNMSDSERRLYDQAEAFKEASDSVAGYTWYVQTAAEKLNEMRANLVSVEAKIAETRARLNSNGAKSDIEDEAKLQGLITDREKINEQIRLQGELTSQLTEKQAKAARTTAALYEYYRDKSVWESMQRGMTEVAYTGDRMAEDIERATVNAFDNMTDAFVEFVQTGKLNFESLADGIIADLTRILVKAYITNNVLSMLGIDPATGTVAGSAQQAQILSLIKQTGLPGVGGSAATLGGLFNGTGTALTTSLADSLHMYAFENGTGVLADAAMTLGDSVSSLNNLLGTTGASSLLAGVGSLGLPLLSGQGITAQSGMQAGGAALGTFLTAGNPIGGVVGGLVGNLLGGMFGDDDPPKFGIDAGILNQAMKTFDKDVGFVDPEAITYDPNFNKTARVKHPIFSAYSKVVATIQENFNEQIFDLADLLPEEFKNQFLTKLEGTDFNAILAGASGGRWKVQDAQQVIEMIAERYTHDLAVHMGEAYGTTLDNLMAAGGSASLLGDNADVWDILSDRAKSSINSKFSGAATAMKEGDVEGGFSALNNVNSAIQQIADAVAPITEALETADLSEYEKSIRSINQQFDQYAAALRAAGVDLERYTDLEKAKSLAVKGVISSMLEDTVSERREALSKAESDLRDAYGREQDRLDEQHSKALDGMNDQLETTNELVSKLGSLVSSLRSTLNSMSLETDDYVMGRRAEAQATLQATLLAARNGQLDPEVDLSDTLSVLSESSEDFHSNFVDYQRDFMKTYLSIAELESLAGEQLSEQESLAALIERQISAEDEWYKKESALLTAQLEATLGLNTAVLSLAQATSNYKAASDNLARVIDSGGSPVSVDSDVQQITALYETLLDRAPDAAGLAYWTNQVKSGAEDMASVFNGFINSAEYKGMNSFAVGTDYVPYDMTANIHRGERIVPAAYNRSDATNEDLLNEIRALRAEMSAGGAETSKWTQKTFKVLDEWNGAGMPEVRV